jgi:hypothetical protein
LEKNNAFPGSYPDLNTARREIAMEIVFAAILLAALAYGAVSYHRRGLSRNTAETHRADQIVRDRYEHNRT